MALFVLIGGMETATSSKVRAHSSYGVILLFLIVVMFSGSCSITLLVLVCLLLDVSWRDYALFVYRESVHSIGWTVVHFNSTRMGWDAWVCTKETLNIPYSIGLPLIIVTITSIAANDQYGNTKLWEDA